MKKLLIALALLAAFVPRTAQATVSCSVPFNLTNGTIADASQVMANYNAILTCLSTSTASSGANSDITSLSGLTTPISPSQGGAQALCGATGLKMVNDTGTPNTEIDITYTQALVTNSLNAVQFGVNGSLILNLGTAGAANALDTGSITASTVYNIFLIGNGTTIASLASLSATAPSLPSGYAFSCRIGAWVTGTTSHLFTLKTFGNNTAVLQKPGGSGSNTLTGFFQTNTSAGIGASCGNGIGGTDTTVLTAYAGIPPTAVSVYGGISSTGYAAVSNVGTSTPVVNEQASNGTIGSGTPLLFSLVLPAASSLYVCATTDSMVISITGWIDSVNAN